MPRLQHRRKYDAESVLNNLFPLASIVAADSSSTDQTDNDFL